MNFQSDFQMTNLQQQQAILPIITFSMQGAQEYTDITLHAMQLCI